MQKWEYHRVLIIPNDPDSQPTLNYWGEEGWELVAVTPVSAKHQAVMKEDSNLIEILSATSESLRCDFKRPIEA